MRRGACTNYFHARCRTSILHGTDVFLMGLTANNGEQNLWSHMETAHGVSRFTGDMEKEGQSVFCDRRCFLASSVHCLSDGEKARARDAVCAGEPN
jgi:hypothetical protein